MTWWCVAYFGGYDESAVHKQWVGDQCCSRDAIHRDGLAHDVLHQLSAFHCTCIPDSFYAIALVS